MKCNDTKEFRAWCHMFLGAALTSRFSSADAGGDRPNFILIYADDQGWPGLSVEMDDRVPESKSDYYQTPHTAKLAKESMRFTNGYAPAPNCSPSRCSLLTGLSTVKTGMTNIIDRTGEKPEGRLITAKNIDTVDTGLMTLPEALKKIEPRYKAAHFGKWHLASGGPKVHGYDESDGETKNGEGNQCETDDPKIIFSLTNRSIAFLEKCVTANDPYYLQVSHYAVHKKIIALPETISKYEKLPKGKRHYVADYAACTEDLDKGVGMLLDAIKRLGLERTTYIIYTSDNGAFVSPELSNCAPLARGKASLYEGGIRIPFMVKGPGIKPGSFCHKSVIHYDLFPTLCDLAGDISVAPENTDGGSMKELLFKGDSGTIKRNTDFLVFHFPHYHMGKGTYPMSAIIKDNFKLIKIWEDESIRLYDLVNDISEKSDLSLKMPEKAKDLETLLLGYLKKNKALMPRPNPDWDEEQQKDFDKKFGNKDF